MTSDARATTEAAGLATSPHDAGLDVRLKLSESLEREHRLARELNDLKLRYAELERELRRAEVLVQSFGARGGSQSAEAFVALERERDQARQFADAVLHSKSWRVLEAIRALGGRRWGK